MPPQAQGTDCEYLQLSAAAVGGSDWYLLGIEGERIQRFQAGHSASVIYKFQPARRGELIVLVGVQIGSEIKRDGRGIADSTAVALIRPVYIVEETFTFSMKVAVDRREWIGGRTAGGASTGVTISSDIPPPSLLPGSASVEILDPEKVFRQPTDSTGRTEDTGAPASVSPPSETPPKRPSTSAPPPQSNADSQELGCVWTCDRFVTANGRHCDCA
jgi:hypothetical protein